MKKIFLISLFAVAAMAASAQTNPVFGIRGALNLSTLTYTFDGGNSTRTTATGLLPGLAAGVFVEVPFSREFSIAPELDYSLKGGVNKSNNKDKVLLGYICLPILVKWNPLEIKGLNVGFGPELGYLVSAKAENNDGGTTVTNDQSGLFNTLDLDLDLGAGYDFTPHFGVDVRYSAGLLNIIKPSLVLGDGASEKFRNSTVQIGLRYLFGR